MSGGLAGSMCGHAIGACGWKRSITKLGLRTRLFGVTGDTPITGSARDELLSGRTEISE